MADHDKVVAAVLHLRKKLCADPPPEPHKILHIIRRLDDLPITVQVLQETGIGKIVNKLRKQGGDITDAVKHLVLSWKELVREAMEAEQQVQQPSPEPSPPPEDTRDESEEESDEEDEEEERGSSDESPEDSSDDGESEEDDASSLEDSPGRFSPPSPPDRNARQKQSSKKSFSHKSKLKPSHKIPEQGKERTLKRPLEESPKPSSESSHRHVKDAPGGKSPVKKKKVEERSLMDSASSSPQKSKRPPANDGGFSNALFPSPVKVASNSPNRTPSRLNEDRKIGSLMKEKKPSQSSKHASSDGGVGGGASTKGQTKKVFPKREKERTSSSSSISSSGGDSGLVNGSVNQSIKRPDKGHTGDKHLSSKAKDSTKSSSSKPSSVSSPTKTHGSSSQKTSSSSSKSSSSSTSKSSSSSSLSKSSSSSSLSKSSSSSLSKSSKSSSSSSSSKSSSLSVSKPQLSTSKSSSNLKPHGASEKDSKVLPKDKNPHTTEASEKKNQDKHKTKPSKSKPVAPSSKKSTRVDDPIDEESNVDSDDPGKEKKRRKMSSGAASGEEEGAQSFVNTGLSFADCLMGPLPTVKTKKPVKKSVPDKVEQPKKKSSGEKSVAKSSSSSKTTSSSKSSKSSSSSSKSSKPSSSSKSSKPGESSKRSQGKASGGSSRKPTEKERVRKEEEERSQKPQTLEDVHREITFNLPEISADYKPMRAPDLSPKRRVTESESEGSYIGTKHARTKVFSGRVKHTYTSVPTLYDSCMRMLLDNIDSLFEIGVPYYIIKPVLEKCSPQQLLKLEDYNSYLVEDTDPLWQFHAVRDFKGAKPQELESWRELYLRKTDERERRFKNLTRTITDAQAKKDPGRLTKMAFVTGPAKPPRSVQRQQARHGTGRITANPVSNPQKAYVPSKHAGDQGPIRSSSSSTIKSGSHSHSHSQSSNSSGSSGSSSVDNRPRENPSYSSISVSSSNGGMSTGRVSKAKTIAPMMQKALKMRKKWKR